MISRISRRLELMRRRIDKGRPDRGGFTLVEIMVVMMILAIGILPLALVQGQSRREVAKADRYATAMEIAQAQLENMKGAGFGNALPDSGISNQMTWQATVQNVSFGMDRLQVVVTWPEVTGQRQVQVSNLVSMR